MLITYTSMLPVFASTSMLHVFASICTLYKYASCLCLNSAMKFYFRMELISSCRYLIGNASFSVSHCAVGPTYLVSGFYKHGLCSGIGHFLHHRWPGGAKSAQTYQPPEPMISIFGYFPARYSLNLPGVSYWHNFVIPPYIGSSSFPQWTLRESSITVWYSPHEVDNSAFMTLYSFKIISYF